VQFSALAITPGVMSAFYKIAYQIGFTPWEHAATHPPAAEQIRSIFEAEEKGRNPPFGSALDVGCGTGIWSVHLAKRGWKVTGIDFVPKAVRAARERARKAGVAVRIVEGDVTELRAAAVGSGFRLIWDFGALHGLMPLQRAAASREVDAVAAADASVLILAWAPGKRGPLPRGASRNEIEADFPKWKVTDQIRFDATGLPRPLRNVDPQCYRLRRV
jgi:SAM-dependent methyltransferase